MYWHCIPCGWSNSPTDRFCGKCGRTREVATDQARWDLFLGPECLPCAQGDPRTHWQHLHPRPEAMVR